MNRLSLFERRLRLGTGLVLAVYVIVHLGNHALGLVSLEVMESARAGITRFWRHWLGTTLLYGSLLTHFILALMSLYRRTTLRMPAWELVQLVLGLCIIPLLAGHVAGTWGARVLMGGEVDYELVVTTILGDPWLTFRQTLLLFVVWSHVSVGLHFCLRLMRWYRQLSWHLYPLVILVPTLAILGVVRVGVDLDVWSETPAAGVEAAYEGPDGGAGGAEDTNGARDATPANKRFHNAVLVSFYGLLALTLLARSLRGRVRRGAGGVTVRHPGGRVLRGEQGQTILEIIRGHRVPHASVCGGRGRCTTCRVRVGAGLDELPAPTPLERAALDRIGAAPNVRLACQTRPRSAVDVMPLLPPGLDVEQSLKRGGVSGSEREVVAMFVDLRGSTTLGEAWMPYDVLFVLNRFFESMSEALSASQGHYAQFAGDGLLALYGLESGTKQGCLDALHGAVDMQARIDRLNEELAGELDEPLVIGMGVHCGEAIVGTMGPPDAPNFSAIGDNVNIAARLEGQTKELGCVLLVSDAVVQAAGLDFTGFPVHSLILRGKREPLIVYSIERPSQIAGLLAM